MEYIKSRIRDVYDFPTKGIVFKDLTTVFKDPRALHIIGWDLSQLYRDKGVTKVVGIESRGFIGGSILAFELGAGFVPVRKPGKLPADTLQMSYKKEYGTDVIEIHRDAITEDDVVVLHDDVIILIHELEAAVVEHHKRAAEVDADRHPRCERMVKLPYDLPAGHHLAILQQALDSGLLSVGHGREKEVEKPRG